MTLPYSDIVMEHFQNPRNVGRIEEPDGKAIEGSPACGDMVAVYLKIDGETHRIGICSSPTAALPISPPARSSPSRQGQDDEEAREITWQEA